MPITYHILPDSNLVISIHEGATSDEEFLARYKALFEDTHFDKAFNRLIDLRQADSAVRGAPALQEFARYEREQYKDSDAAPKTAIVAPRDLSFGLARMYEAYADIGPGAVVAFRAVDAALAWLSVPLTVLEDIQHK